MAMEIFTYIIPFIFVLAVVYGALDFANVFRKNSAKGLVSLAIAFFALTSEPVTEFIYGILPYAVILFVVVFFLAFIVKLLKGKGGERKTDWTLAMIVIVLVLIFLASQGEDLVTEFLPSMPVENFMYAVGLILILLIFYAVYKNWGGEAPAKTQAQS
jgi:hypothetical protein